MEANHLYSDFLTKKNRFKDSTINTYFAIRKKQNTK